MKLSTKMNIKKKIESIAIAIFVSMLLVAVLPFAHLLIQILFTEVNVELIKASMSDGNYTPIYTIAFTSTAFLLNNKKIRG
jgi:hypothetical protein